MRRVIAWIGRFAATLLFRRVEVAGLERCPTGRPVLLVANHFNGFVDPVLIATASGGCPASSPRPACRRSRSPGWCCGSVGVVFVHRRVDAGGTR